MSNKGSCELCTKPARMLCESDQASLCWDCDEKVHSANFLVAKHSRTLLCHVCFSPTPWKADGLKMGPTVSVCHACYLIGERGQEVCQESESDDGEYASDIDTDTESDYSEEDEDDGENQVVPWTETAAAVVTSTVSSTEEEEEETSLKRMRDYPFEYEDEDGCSSSQNSDSKLCEAASDRIKSSQSQSDDNSGTSSPSRLLRPLKMSRTSDNSDCPLVLTDLSGQLKSLKGTAAIVDKLRRLQQEIVTEEGDASTVILGIRKLARDA